MDNRNGSSIDLLLVHGHYSSFQEVADNMLPALQEFGDAGLVFSGGDKILNTHRFANWAMFLMLKWEARENEVRVLKEFRKDHAETPVIVHSLSDDPKVRMKAFTTGADNFVSPDCAKPEIDAKMRRLLRPTKRERFAPISVQVRDLTIWPAEKVVLRNGRRIHLSKREFDTLVYLANERPKSVSRRTLEREVFGLRTDPGTNVVAVHISRLRKKIAADKRTLRTVPGGYQLL